MSFPIVLAPDDEDRAVALELREQSNRFPDFMVTKRNDARVGGFLAEVLAARWCGLDPRRVLAGGFDRGVDFTVGGETVQVKWNGYVGGDLYLSAAEPTLRADYAILATPATRDYDDDRLILVGWIDREGFQHEAHQLEWMRRAPARCGNGLEQHKLYPMHSFPARVPV